MRGRTVWKCHVISTLAVIAASAASARAQLVNTTPTTTTTVTTTATSGTSILPTASGAKAGAAHVIEWDLPDGFDFNPGAVAVDTRGEDNNRAWFVTRLGGSTEADPLGAQRKVYRFDFSPSLMKNGGAARWTSWEVAADVENNGGVAKLRPSHDRRFVVVRTNTSIQEIDTQACFPGTPAAPAECPFALRRWDAAGDPDLVSPFLVSDLAVDDARRIFSVGQSSNFQGGYIQMLVPTKVPYTASTVPIEVPAGTVTRWADDGVNQCGTNNPGFGGVCNSGIDFHPSSNNQNLIYVSNQIKNSIDELNAGTSSLRRWILPADDKSGAVQEPRQLKIDNNGFVWVITGSGHLVSLNPKNSSGCSSGMNRMTIHKIPVNAETLETENDGWGLAPDSNVVGYTDANNSKVGMLVPHDNAKCVWPSIPVTTRKEDTVATVTMLPTRVVSDVARGVPKIVLKQTTSKQDGTFVEAVINKPAPGTDPTLAPPDSMVPLGITPVRWKGQGTFLYAVGFTATGDGEGPIAKRIGFVRLGIPEKIKNPRDDDDADDGMDRTQHPGWHQPEAGDDDADGVPDEQDTPTNRENMSSYDAASTPAFSATTYYPVTTTASTLTLLATAKADDLTATIAVDIYNAMGLLVATSGPVPGLATVTMIAPAAGTYNISVRNLSGRAVNVTPTILMREPPM